MKAATLFSGGEGAGLGMAAAGFAHAWGIEYDDRIAQVARDNGFNVLTADILQCDPTDFEAVDWLHASPPCPNFSNAKTNAEETENDRALAAKVCEFITELLPRVFTLENVYQYRKSKSWQRIARTLLTHGYAVNYWHVNMADYGVPQTRKRMIAIARRDGQTPMLPPATHDEKPQAQLFGAKRPWVSWYEAVEDLIPTLPDSEFAPWQLERLPEAIKKGMELDDSFFIGGANKSKSFLDFAIENRPSIPGIKTRDEPINSIPADEATNGSGRAFLLEKDKGDYSINHREENETAQAVTANDIGRRRAFIVTSNQQNSTIQQMTPKGKGQPCDTILATEYRRPSTVPKAFIVDDGNSKDGMIKHQGQPMATVRTMATGGTFGRAMANGRVVKMTPHALARFQSFPDTYQLPDSNALACRIIGNAIPPLFMQRLGEWLR